VSLLPKTLPHHLVEQIRQGIIEGRYAPGSRLGEQALEAEYGCSRGPIREALRLLELRGLVTHAPRHGFRVRAVDAAAVRQIYALRAVLERHAVEALRDHVTPALIAALRAANAEVKRHRDAQDVGRYIQANLQFHALILQQAGNEALRRAMGVVNEMAEPMRFAHLRRSLRTSRAAEQHDALIALLEAGRLQEAAAAMERHILGHEPAALAALETG
jgi:DNA-binding GntR family transcriptional regulator